MDTVTIKEDALILDRGENRSLSERFSIVALGEGTVSRDGFLTSLGREFSHKYLLQEAERHKVKVLSAKGFAVDDEHLYEDDRVLAYNGGDLIPLESDLSYWLLMHGHAES